MLVVLSSTPKINPQADYIKLKKRLNKSTLGYGSAIAASYFIAKGADEGVSATLGVLTSFAYLNSLSRHVDNIEHSPIQKQILFPVGTAIFETMWNRAPFAFDFDYSATFIGFLAYKFALTTVLFETVREILLMDSKTYYDTSKKVYNDLSEDDEVREQYVTPREEKID